ncbi:unnamed protein product [Withania somnifera]
MAAFLRASCRSLLSSSRLPFASQAVQKPPFDSNILRIFGNEIEYQLDYAPPHSPVTKFNAFMVEDRPGEKWITLKRKFGKDEHIKIKATMIDGAITVRLHINVLVDIWKGEGSDFLEFVCSSWLNSLEIQKLYLEVTVLKGLNSDFRDGLNVFLKARGINDELFAFLHEFMMNKDRLEAIGWLRKLQFFIKN